MELAISEIWQKFMGKFTKMSSKYNPHRAQSLGSVYLTIVKENDWG
jgi:hypothetical protein